MDERTLTWRRLHAETAVLLGDPVHARWICQHASGASGAEWLGILDAAATERAIAHLDAMVARRLAGEPLQYVLGSWSFRHLDLLVDRRVLIPRPETEQLVDVCLELVKRRPPPYLLADLGTGSGAIALSLAAELPRGSSTVWATDASAAALDVCRANLAGLGVKGANVRLALGNWFAALPTDLRGTVDLIVSNPPYVADASPEVEAAVEAWEPPEALFAGTEGLDDIRAIVDGVRWWLAEGGFVALEIGAEQGASVHDLLESAGLVDVDIRQDLAGHDRFATARKPVGVS